MPPRSKSKPRNLNTSSDNESSPSVIVRHIESSTKKKVKSSSDSESPVRKKTIKKSSVKTPIKKKTIKRSSSSESTPVRFFTRKKVKSPSTSESSTMITIRHIKSTTNSSEDKTGTEKSTSDSSSTGKKEYKSFTKKNKSPSREKTTPRTKKVLSSSSSSDGEPTVRAKKILSNTPSTSVEPTINTNKGPIIKTKSVSGELGIKPSNTEMSTKTTYKYNKEDEQEKSSEDSDVKSYLNKVLPKDLANIIVGMTEEFKGELKIFENVIKTDMILFYVNNIIYLQIDKIASFDLDNHKPVFEVNHSYDFAKCRGIFKIRNNLIILEKYEDRILKVGVHNIKNGIKIKTIMVDLPGEINHEVETPKNIILKIGTKLYILDPFGDDKLIELEKGDLVPESRYGDNPLRKWERGFYVVGKHTIHIFNSTKLINKIISKDIITSSAVDGDIFYWFSDSDSGKNITRYNIGEKGVKEGNFGDHIFSEYFNNIFNVRGDKIFFHETLHAPGSLSHSYTVDFMCFDFKTNELTHIYTSSDYEKSIVFADYIDDKVIFVTKPFANMIIMYDFNRKEMNYLEMFKNTITYLDTIPTNKVIFIDRNNLIVLR